eukprot:TRINITY_DN49357_c0_g1_i3.p1 TRINITY_DN49357_c0_g1~~TRINITY_DN49357_c0_g1_i3.p1  ORF type:complete len:509 (-),score=95.60 TRINITY_DN49357_c0_g1_i3:98-1480(-)
MPVSADSVPQLQKKIMDIANTVEDEFAEVGLVVNYSAGKTEVLIHTDKHLTAGDKSAINVLRRIGIPVPRTGQIVKVVDKYCHLGEVRDKNCALTPNLRKRTAITTAAISDVSSLLRSDKVSLKHKRYIIEVIVCSKLLHNSQTWRALTQKQLDILRVPYYRAIRLALGLSMEDRVPNVSLQTQGFMDIEPKIRRRRLRYASRVIDKAPEMLKALIQEEDRLCSQSWVAAVREDVMWAAERAGGHGEEDELMQAFATGQPTAHFKKVFEDEEACLVEEQKSGVMANDEMLCMVCGKECTDARQAHGHLVSAHGMRCWTEDVVNIQGRCLHCDMHFYCPHRLAVHLQRVWQRNQMASCAAQMTLRGTQPSSAEQKGEVAAAVADLRKKRRAQGRSLGFAEDFAQQGPEKSEEVQGPLPCWAGRRRFSVALSEATGARAVAPDADVDEAGNRLSLRPAVNFW